MPRQSLSIPFKQNHRKRATEHPLEFRNQKGRKIMEASMNTSTTIPREDNKTSANFKNGRILILKHFRNIGNVLWDQRVS